jgi:hypothetical protein
MLSDASMFCRAGKVCACYNFCPARRHESRKPRRRISRIEGAAAFVVPQTNKCAMGRPHYRIFASGKPHGSRHGNRHAFWYPGSFIVVQVVAIKENMKFRTDIAF